MSLLSEINIREMPQSLTVKMQFKELYRSGYNVTEIFKNQFSKVLECCTLFIMIWPITHEMLQKLKRIKCNNVQHRLSDQ